MDKNKSRKKSHRKNTSPKKWNKLLIGLLTLLCVCGLLPGSFSGRLTEGNLPGNIDLQSAYIAVSEAVSEVVSEAVSEIFAEVPSAPDTRAEEDSSHTASNSDSQPDSPFEGSGLEVHFLDVGQGLSVLISADGRYMLYDGGDRNTSSFVVAYLKDKGVKTLDYLIASHYDADHLNGLVGALHAFDTGQVFGPDYETDTKIYHSFTSIVQESEKTVMHPQPGERCPIGSGYFEILAPLSDGYGDVNNYSIAIRLVYGETSFLITGDAEQESEQEMTAYWPDLSADVLCIGHHGSPTSTSDELLDKVNPSVAVISCGQDNSYGHPGEAVLNRLKSRSTAVYRTDKSGTIILSSDGSSLSVSYEHSK